MVDLEAIHSPPNAARHCDLGGTAVAVTTRPLGVVGAVDEGVVRHLVVRAIDENTLGAAHQVRVNAGRGIYHHVQIVDVVALHQVAGSRQHHADIGIRDLVVQDLHVAPTHDDDTLRYGLHRHGALGPIEVEPVDGQVAAIDHPAAAKLTHFDELRLRQGRIAVVGEGRDLSARRDRDPSCRDFGRKNRVPSGQVEHAAALVLDGGAGRRNGVPTGPRRCLGQTVLGVVARDAIDVARHVCGCKRRRDGTQNHK